MRDALLALFLLSAFPMILYRYQVGALVIGFMSFMYPQSNAYGFAFTVQWIDYFFVATIAMYFLQAGYKDYKHHPLINVVLALYFWTCLSTYFGFLPDISYELWMKFTKVLLLAIIVFAMLNTEKRLIAFMKVMVLSISFYGIKGGLFTLSSGGASQVLGPINSFFADNNGTALVLVMTLPFMMFFVTHAKNIYQKYFALFCTLSTAVAILGTQSRTGFVALMAALLYFIWLQKKLFRAILFIVPVALVALFFMPQSWTDRMLTSTNPEADGSFQGRVEMWRASIGIANDNPFLGGGFDVIYSPEAIAKYIPPGDSTRAIHSAYFQMMAEHGYVGFMIYMLVLCYIFLTARKLKRQSREVPHLSSWYPDLSTAVSTSTAAYMVMALTANIAFFDLLYFVLIITAIADVILQRARNPLKYTPYEKDTVVA